MFMLVRREALEAVGPMDERFFVFGEEADWCRRFWAAGWRCVFAPTGRILHVDGGNKSTDQARLRMFIQLQKGILLFHRKHHGRLGHALARALFATFMPLRAAWWFARGRVTGAAEHRRRAHFALVAARFHWTGREPR
jgi:GT2 family glycosyltransferase